MMHGGGLFDFVFTKPQHFPSPDLRPRFFAVKSSLACPGDGGPSRAR